MAGDKTGGNATKWTYLSDREVRAERIFDAPRELVFRAYTDPRLIPQWWGPAYLTTTVEKMDVRPGGEWRYIQRDNDGNVYGFHGQYREVVPPERLVSTFEFEGTPGSVIVDSATFIDMGAKTKLVVTSVATDPQVIKDMQEEGMEQGANETYDRLAALLAELVRSKA